MFWGHTLAKSFNFTTFVLILVVHFCRPAILPCGSNTPGPVCYPPLWVGYAHRDTYVTDGIARKHKQMARKKRKTKPKQTAEAIASTPQQVFPKLGHQLIISHPKPIQGLKQSEGWMRIAPTWSQRLRRFFTTFSEAFIFSLWILRISKVTSWKKAAR